MDGRSERMAAGQILYIPAVDFVDSNLQLFTMFTWEEEGGRLKAGSSKGGAGLAEKWRSPSLPPRVCRNTDRWRIAFNRDGLRWRGMFEWRGRAFYELLARLKFVRISCNLALLLEVRANQETGTAIIKESRIANFPSLLFFSSLFFPIAQNWALNQVEKK